MKCNLCESLETIFILSGSDSYMKVDKKKFDIYQCKNCKVTSLQPMPTQEELKKYYPSNYKVYTQDMSPNNTKSKNLTYFKNLIMKKLKMNNLERILERFSSKKINYLDYGCGNGKNIKQLSSKYSNWTFFGYDKFNKNIDNLKTKNVSFYSSNFLNNMPNDYFDVINLSSVIEHIIDPKNLILLLKKKLSKDGILIIKTPNFNSLSRKMFGQHWHNLDIPRHLHIFSDHNLEKILNELEFTKIKILYSRNSAVEVKSFYKLFNLKKRPKIHNIIVNLLNPFTLILSLLKLSSTFTIIVKKEV